ncbi:hypothetical protein [Oenococcus sicerae]|uniref:Uncharacterized protein n=1 Tax=Oenococcus sicerae TaxID=2203724 RepID=A0AAJ1RAC3_9LACO|nr:hypothetical protein [Oenococcus sicerae]MDN6900662.1 hypothetical protein [Oenococcus sicerae]
MIPIYICIAILVAIVLILLLRNIKIKFKETTHPIWDIALILSAFFLLAYILSAFKVFNREAVIDYVISVKDMLQVLFLLIIIIIFCYILIGFLGKRYSLRIDKFNIGGINILFDKSSDIYIKTVGTFISSKRSLFNFKKTRDNIYEVLNTYYEVYNFIRSNLELLDPIKDKKLYETSVAILKMLNNFLTTHQNDYRRWYDKIISNDRITSNGKKIIVHETTIEDIQNQYYRYDELLNDIHQINRYMSKEDIKDIFRVNIFDWESNENA